MVEMGDTTEFLLHSVRDTLDTTELFYTLWCRWWTPQSSFYTVRDTTELFLHSMEDMEDTTEFFLHSVLYTLDTTEFLLQSLVDTLWRLPIRTGRAHKTALSVINW